MIKTASKEQRYQTSFTNGKYSGDVDATVDKGGAGAGFRPHELLEAALAVCMNVHLRRCADKYSIPLLGAATTVTLDRKNPEEVFFDYSVQLEGPLSNDDREKLLEELKMCPVRKTLSTKLSFRV